ncbi:protease HtpX [Thioflexithrix psekupsensis]|uniref:Protease HtpX n=1 Tax=Thioflexithrix psekupsensis TaxID=1570016 RepID=A0A251XBH2_9GAMM|nr:protease HtpX [Thioflexithrix psekupsensis]OUD15440.1 zinc metalloprotease HtpX [Thioflexithrix psekupsensis]
MKRITLFLLTNIAIVLLLGIIARIFGIYSNGLIASALLFGMGGAFISLLISKWMAKKATNARVIEQPRSNEERWLVETVRRQAQQAGIGMPEVAIYESQEVNAFATGANQNNALVAVSRGLLERMSQDEIEAVLAHEVSHVANGDMITMALIQGVVNTFVILLARLVGSIVASNSRGNGHAVYALTSFIAEIIFGLLAMPIVMWFSRYREFHADAGAAKLAGSQKMIAALRCLQTVSAGQLPEQLSAFGINSSPSRDFIRKLFSSHPPLEERIAALQNR